MKTLVPSLLVACTSASGAPPGPAATILGASVSIDPKQICCTLDIDLSYDLAAPEFVTKADFTFCRQNLTNEWGCAAPSPPHSYAFLPNPDPTPGHALLHIDVPTDLVVPHPDKSPPGPLIYSMTLVTGAGARSAAVHGSLEFPKP